MNKEEFYNQGMEHFAEDRLDDAVAAYLHALDEDPNYADALHALAMTYAHQEKVDQAIDVAKRLIAAAPELYEALRGMVSIHDSVTMGQESEFRDKWLPIARAALAKVSP